MDPQPSPPVEPQAPATPTDPTEVKPVWYLIKGADGQGSITATMVLVSFLVTTLGYLASLVSKVGPVTFRAFDTAACSTYFIPIVTMYFGHRWIDANAKNPPSSRLGS